MIAKKDSEGSEDRRRESINHLREIYLNSQEQRKSRTLPYTILPTVVSESEAPDRGRPLTNWGHLSTQQLHWTDRLTLQRTKPLSLERCYIPAM